MITKKDIPYNLLTSIEEVAIQNLDIIQFVKEDNTYYCFVETDVKSRYFFKIFINGSARIGNADPNKFTYEWRPTDLNQLSESIIQGDLQEVTLKFKTWIGHIKTFNETLSIHDDNFTKQYAEFYFNEFRILDLDADISPFNPDQQDLIELYLESLADSVESYNKEIESPIISEILLEIKEVKESLATSTKTKVMKGITKIFGKLFKVSKSFGKDVVKEAKKKLIKKLFELGIEYGTKLIDMFSKNDIDPTTIV